MKNLLLILLLPTLAFAQVSQNSTNVGATQMTSGLSALLGNAIGQQNNNTNTNITGGAGNTNLSTPAETSSKVVNVPSMSAPMLVANGSDICLGSQSGAFSMLGYGISGGRTVVDENCVMLKNSARLKDLGFVNASVGLLLSNKEISKVIRDQSPIAYLMIVKDKALNLKAEIDVSQEYGEDSSGIEEEFKRYQREIKILELRIKNSPELLAKLGNTNFNQKE
jgi:hypothetical protein